MCSEHFGDGEHEVGCGGSFGQFSGQLEPDDFGCEHVDGLSEHHGFGFDATDSPTDDSQPVDHRGVAVGPDQAVGVGDSVLDHDNAGEIFEVDLVNDPGGWWDNAKIVEGLLSPAKEPVAFLVAFEFSFDVVCECVDGGELVDLDRVINDEVAGDQRVDLARVATDADHCRSESGEVDDGWDTGEVLQNDAAWFEGDFGRLDRVGGPSGQSGHVVGGDDESVDVSQAGFEQDSNRVGQGINLAESEVGECIEAVVGDVAGCGGECGGGVEGIGRVHLGRTPEV